MACFDSFSPFSLRTEQHKQAAFTTRTCPCDGCLFDFPSLCRFSSRTSTGHSASTINLEWADPWTTEVIQKSSTVEKNGMLQTETTQRVGTSSDFHEDTSRKGNKHLWWLLLIPLFALLVVILVLLINRTRTPRRKSDEVREKPMETVSEMTDMEIVTKRREPEPMRYFIDEKFGTKRPEWDSRTVRASLTERGTQKKAGPRAEGDSKTVDVSLRTEHANARVSSLHLDSRPESVRKGDSLQTTPFKSDQNEDNYSTTFPLSFSVLTTEIP